VVLLPKPEVTANSQDQLVLCPKGTEGVSKVMLELTGTNGADGARVCQLALMAAIAVAMLAPVSLQSSSLVPRNWQY